MLLEAEAQREDLPFDERILGEVFSHIDKLHGVARLARKLHETGLERDELKELLDLVEIIIVTSTQRSDLAIVKRLKDIKEAVGKLPGSFYPFKPREKALKLRDLLHKLPSLPPPPLGPPLPSPRDLADMLGEIDMLIDVFVHQFYNHTRVLSQLFNVLRPEAIPWLIRFIEKNPGYVRTVIGEPLCIWWFSRVLSRERRVWRNAIGPLKIMGEETDILSLHTYDDQCEYAIAEVKITRNADELRRAIAQVINKAAFLSQKLASDHSVLKALQQMGFEARGTCKLQEIAVATLYKLEGMKNELRVELAGKAREKSIVNVELQIYDIDDIIGSIEGFSGKERYRELFLTINRILETT